MNVLMARAARMFYRLSKSHMRKCAYAHTCIQLSCIIIVRGRQDLFFLLLYTDVRVRFSRTKLKSNHWRRKLFVSLYEPPMSASKRNYFMP